MCYAIFNPCYLSSVINSSSVRRINVKVSSDVSQPQNCSQYLDNLETLVANSLHLVDDVSLTRFVFSALLNIKI